MDMLKLLNQQNQQNNNPTDNFMDYVGASSEPTTTLPAPIQQEPEQQQQSTDLVSVLQQDSTPDSGSFYDRVSSNEFQIDNQYSDSSIEQKAQNAELRVLSKIEVQQLPDFYIKDVNDGDTVSDKNGEILRLAGYDSFETDHGRLTGKSKFGLESQAMKAYKRLGIEPSEATVGREDKLVHIAGIQETNKLIKLLNRKKGRVKIRRMGKDKFGRTLAEIYDADTGESINERMKTKYNQPKYIGGKYVGEKNKLFDSDDEKREFIRKRAKALSDYRRHKEGADELYQNIKYSTLDALDGVVNGVKGLVDIFGVRAGELLIEGAGHLFGDEKHAEAAVKLIDESEIVKRLRSKSNGFKNAFEADNYYIQQYNKRVSKKFDDGDILGSIGEILSTPSALLASVAGEAGEFIAGGALGKAAAGFKLLSKASKILPYITAGMFVAAGRQATFEQEYRNNHNGEEMPVYQKIESFVLNASVNALEASIIGGIGGKLMPNFTNKIIGNVKFSPKVTSSLGAETLREFRSFGNFKFKNLALEATKGGIFEGLQEAADQNIESRMQKDVWLDSKETLKAGMLGATIGFALPGAIGSIKFSKDLISTESQLAKDRRAIKKQASSFTDEEIEALELMQENVAEYYNKRAEETEKYLNELKEAQKNFIEDPASFVESLSSENTDNYISKHAKKMFSNAMMILSDNYSEPVEKTSTEEALGSTQKNHFIYHAIKTVFDSSGKENGVVLDALLKNLPDNETGNQIREDLNNFIETVNVVKEHLDTYESENSHTAKLKELLSMSENELQKETEINDKISFISNTFKSLSQALVYEAKSEGGTVEIVNENDEIISQDDFDTLPHRAIAAIISTKSAYTAETASKDVVELITVLKSRKSTAYAAKLALLISKEIKNKKAKNKNNEINEKARKKSIKHMTKSLENAGERTEDNIPKNSYNATINAIMGAMIKNEITESEKKGINNDLDYYIGSEEEINSKYGPTDMNAREFYNKILDSIPIAENIDESEQSDNNQEERTNKNESDKNTGNSNENNDNVDNKSDQKTESEKNEKPSKKEKDDTVQDGTQSENTNKKSDTKQQEESNNESKDSKTSNEVKDETKEYHYAKKNLEQAEVDIETKKHLTEINDTIVGRLKKILGKGIC